MSGLPREILKWIQSLDLSYSVKNVKRDFANGFLVAEIFSRYHRAEFTMHSYINGSSLACKKNNWEQIQHVWSKLKDQDKIPDVIGLDEVDKIIYSKRDAARNLVCKIYSILTDREIPETPNVNATGVIPPYAKPTTSNLIGQSLKNLKEEETDIRMTSSIAQDIVYTQNQSIKLEKMENPERFRRAPKNVSRVPTRQVGMDDNTSTQFNFVKEVNIKEIDNPTELHRDTMKQAHLANQLVNSLGLNMMSQTQGSGEMLGVPEYSSTAAPTRIAIVSVDEIVETHHREFSPDQDLQFDEIMALDPNEIGAAFDAVDDHVIDRFVESCLQSPREYYQFSSMCLSVAGAEGALPSAMDATAALLMSVGEKLRESSRHLTLQSFSDFTLPRWAQILMHQPAKRETLCKIFAAFNIQQGYSHAEQLRRLKEHVQDVKSLVPCLAVLATFERDFQDDIFEIYRYHCVCAINNPDPLVQTGGMAILTELLHSSAGVDLAFECFDQVANLIHGTWEVQAQSIMVMANLLKRIDHRHENIQKVYEVADAQLGESTGHVRQIALWNYGSVLRVHPSLLQHFMDSLLLSADEERDALLCNGELNIESDLFGFYHLTCPNPEWAPLALWRGVANTVEEQHLENLSREHVNLLFVALNLLAEFPSEEAAGWAEVFDRLKTYLLVELCDENHVEGVVQTILKFCHDPCLSNRVKRILFGGDVPCFFGILNLLIPTGAESCQRLVQELLEELSTIPCFSPSIQSLLSYFNEHEPVKFQQTMFRQMVEQTES